MNQNFCNVFTIGFTEKPASYFFEALRGAGVRRVIDVRLHNNSQLAGFAKEAHLPYFLKQIVAADYIHLSILAPTPALFNAYKKNGAAWEDYAPAFLRLMEERRIENELDRSLFDNGCLLCSEHQPHHCHRRLVAEYLQRKWGNLEITHLV